VYFHKIVIPRSRSRSLESIPSSMGLSDVVVLVDDDEEDEAEV